jgi:predicted NBD/HSP70 family sugar kinase
MAESFGVPTFLANDANLAALGEFRFGAGQGVRDLILSDHQHGHRRRDHY